MCASKHIGSVSYCRNHIYLTLQMKSIFQALTAKNVAGKKSRIMLFFLSLHQQEYLEAKNVGIVK